MKALEGKGKVKCDPPKGWRTSPERRGLLAKVHIAYPQLHLTDEDYWRILEREFGDITRKGLSKEELAKGKRTAKYLSNFQLQYLVEYFVQHGWTPQGAERRAHSGQQTTDNGQQCKALRDRCRDLARQIENGDRRLRGLSKKILGVDCLTWCRDPGRLKRVLAALEKIKKIEVIYD